MAVTRSELREKIMIILYQYDLMKNSNLDCDIEAIIKDNVEVENDFIKDMVYGVITYKDELDKLANLKMVDWDITRIDKTGAAILRLALYELKYTDTPEVVVINEAVELAKKYSDDAVRKMINAVLDKCIKE
ncbi:MAG: transcription antitermination factor NusB [Bacilli bacterium]|jgi:N utilization substance protein B|nr:transcription antitermination factor NusB [Bacilli bacterium]MCX4253972.1 transcription antitermination factor NusB [Bacilli bacterium]